MTPEQAVDAMLAGLPADYPGVRLVRLVLTEVLAAERDRCARLALSRRYPEGVSGLTATRRGYNLACEDIAAAVREGRGP
jgi:hypothetical protein